MKWNVTTKKFNRLLKKKSKDREALAEIYKCFYPLVVIHINRNFHSKVDGNDVAQQFFLKLLDMEIKAPIRHPLSWIYTIAEHIAIAELRKKNRREAIELPAAEVKSEDCSDNSKEMLDCLDSKHRQIVYMHYWEGYKFIEISDIMSINYSTLKSMHTKAKNILRENLEKEKE